MAGLNTITSVGGENQLSAEDRTYYEKGLLSRLNPNLIHDQAGIKKSIPRNSGTVVQFRRFERIVPSSSPTALTEGSAGSAQTMTVTPITATPSQYGDYVKLSDRLILQGQDDNIKEAVNLVGDLGGETLDVVYRNALVLGTKVLYAGGKSATNELDNTCRASVALFKRAGRNLLKIHNKPFPNGYIMAFISVDTAHDLKNDPEWIEAKKAGMPQAIYKGEIGEIDGIKFIVTSNAYVDSAGGASTGLTGIQYTDDSGNKADVHNSLLFCPEAYGIVGVDGQNTPELIVKQLGSSGTADPLNQLSTVGYKVFALAKILDNNRMYRIEHTVSE